MINFQILNFVSVQNIHSITAKKSLGNSSIQKMLHPLFQNYIRSHSFDLYGKINISSERFQLIMKQ